MGATGVGREAKNLIDALLMGFRTRGFSDMHHTPIAPGQCGGDALLAAQGHLSRSAYIGASSGHPAAQRGVAGDGS